MIDEFLILFFLSSSLPIYLFTIIYMGFYYRLRNRPFDVPFEKLAIIVPFLHGIFGYINCKLVEECGDNISYLVGAVFGFLMAFISTRIFKLNELLYHCKCIYPVFIISYSLLFRFVITIVLRYLKEFINL